jgi:hypothetical protein
MIALAHDMKVAVSFLLLLCLAGSFAAQQNKNLDLLKGLNFFETDRAQITKLFSENMFSMWDQENRQVFFRTDENVEVEYSTGNCSDTDFDEDTWFLGPDIWITPKGKAVRINYQPKHEVKIGDLGFDLSTFKKEALQRGRKQPIVYFSKKDGIAITAWREYVESVTLFPGARFHKELCPNPDVSRYFASPKWGFRPQPKWSCILLSKPADVQSIDVRRRAGETAFDITVSATDPENDILSYIYLIRRGRILGNGAKVIWDLSGEKPGIYDIRIAADDGSGPRGKWTSHSVTVDQLLGTFQFPHFLC